MCRLCKKSSCHNHMGVQNQSILADLAQVNANITRMSLEPKTHFSAGNEVISCDPSGVPGMERFQCKFTNRLSLVMCTFDGGEAEICSFPVTVTFDRFGLHRHTLELTVYDIFGQALNHSLDFQLVDREFHFLTLSVNYVTECIALL